MASDAALASSMLGQPTSQAEGEPAPDLVAFAKALTEGGLRIFGADYEPNTTNQLSIFQDGARYLDYFEVVDGNRVANSIATAEGITTVPTWKARGGGSAVGFLSLQELVNQTGLSIPLSNTPSFFPIESQTVKVGSPLHIPVDAYDPNGDPLTITVSSSNPSSISAQVLANNPSARVTVDGYGEMIFQLFQSDAPRPANRFIELARNGFFNTTATNTMTFHRAVEDFIIQAGDPTGTGSGGSALGDFNDQYSLNLQHNRSGVLSYAKTSNDTNDSQFFITDGEARFLDYNHSIFGQLIEGERVRAGIDRIAILPPLPSGQKNVPAFDVVIRSVEIFNDTENGLIRLIATGAPGTTSNITVTVRDANGNQASQVFAVTVAEDDANGTPFFGDILPGVQLRNRPVTLNLSAIDIDEENDPGWYAALKVRESDPISIQFDSTTGSVTITPNDGFVGRAEFFVIVAKGPLTLDDLATPSLYDSQLVSVDFVAPFSLSVSHPSIFEGDGLEQSAQVTVTRPTVGSSVPLEISLAVTDPSKLFFPPSVTFPADSTSVSFTISAINSLQIEGLQRVTIRGEALDYSAEVAIDVLDDESNSPWHHVPSPHDVNRDGSLDPLDVLLVINQLIRSGVAWLPRVSPAVSFSVDTDNDHYVTPLDVLRVINALNRRGAVGEGEANGWNTDASGALSAWVYDEIAVNRQRRSR
jgi:cyclophilin family peptidyl-prolyl cis-trans isomerase